MQTNPSHEVEAIGYLTSREDENLGFIGGLLVVNRNARPVEYHSTVPFRPTAAQRVFYGATLRPQLLAHQIPEALLGKAKSDLDVVLVDDYALLEFRTASRLPVGCLWNPVEKESTESGNDGHQDFESGGIAHSANALPAVGPGKNRLDEDDSLVIGNARWIRKRECSFAIHHEFVGDEAVVAASLQQIARQVDVDEPMERLRLAIDETCKSSKQAA